MNECGCADRLDEAAAVVKELQRRVDALEKRVDLAARFVGDDLQARANKRIDQKNRSRRWRSR